MGKLRKHEIKKGNEVIVVKYGERGLKWWRRCWGYAEGQSRFYYKTDPNGCGIWFCDELNHREVPIAATFQFCTSDHKNPFLYVKRITDSGCQI